MNSASAIPAWVTILSALLTPMIAVGVGCIGFLQWRTAERKRRQDLFDRRFDLFMKLWRIYSDQVGGIINTEGDLFEMAYEAEFLFGADVSKHLFRLTQDDTQIANYADFAKPFGPYLSLEGGFWR